MSKNKSHRTDLLFKSKMTFSHKWWHHHLIQIPVSRCLQLTIMLPIHLLIWITILLRWAWVTSHPSKNNKLIILDWEDLNLVHLRMIQVLEQEMIFSEIVPPNKMITRINNLILTSILLLILEVTLSQPNKLTKMQLIKLKVKMEKS